MTKLALVGGNQVATKTVPVTICVQCAHFINKEPMSVRKDEWYNHLCEAKPLPTKMDTYDGKMKHWKKNDFGQEFFTDDEYENCRNVNDGKCLKFQEK